MKLLQNLDLIVIESYNNKAKYKNFHNYKCFQLGLGLFHPRSLKVVSGSCSSRVESRFGAFIACHFLNSLFINAKFGNLYFETYTYMIKNLKSEYFEKVLDLFTIL